VKLFKGLLAIPATSLLVAAGVASGACSSASVGSPDAGDTAPSGLRYPAGVGIGGACSGEVYFADGDGYVVCKGGAWGYSDVLPPGYAIDPNYADWANCSCALNGGSTSTSARGGTCATTTTTANEPEPAEGPCYSGFTTTTTTTTTTTVGSSS
jgi:hypothetical protein